MTTNLFQELKIGNLTARMPIIQGGMGIGVSLSGLAAAVANEGGIGIIAAAGIGTPESDYSTNWFESNTRALKREIAKARELSKGIIGVNIMVALTDYAGLVKTAIAEKIDIIFSGAGMPLDLPSYLQEGDQTKLVPIVSSARAAGILCKKWLDKFNYLPDAIVVEGPMAGGHLGFKEEQLTDPNFSLEKLVTDVISTVKPYIDKYLKPIPVIAAGGIYTGADIRRFLQLGAAGVQMATRFVTTTECDASLKFKQAYIDAKKEDIVIIKSPVGMPGRAIRSPFTESVSDGKKIPYHCSSHCLKTCDNINSPYCITWALVSAKKGNFNHGFAFAGENAYRATAVSSVKQVMDDLKTEYAAAL